MKITLLIVSHALIGALGFAAGIYTLPILTAPKSPSAEEIKAGLGKTMFEGRFLRNLEGSDFLHWGEGTVHVGPDSVSFLGQLAPGPDYKLYLSPEFVETEAAFIRVKPEMVRVGDVKTFENFNVPLPAGVNAEKYTTAIVWCETFGEFISAAKYR